MRRTREATVFRSVVLSECPRPVARVAHRAASLSARISASLRPVRFGGASVLLAGATAITATAAHQAAAIPLRFAQPIAFARPLDREELIQIDLPGEAYAELNEGMPDLRVLNADDAEVAMVLRRATITRDKVERSSWPAPKPVVVLTDDGGAEIAFEIDERDPAPHGLRIVSPLVDFERRIEVVSSADGAEWTPRVENGLLYDYSQLIDARDDSLRLADLPEGVVHRRFRVVVKEVTQEQQSQLMELTRKLRSGDEAERTESVLVRRTPFRIDRIELWRETVRQRAEGPRLADYAVEFQVDELNDEQQRSIVMVSTKRQPISSLELVVADRNFSRTVRVEAESERPGGAVAWRSIAQGVLSRLEFRDLRRQHVRIEFPETRSKRLRVIVENRDSPPLNLTGVTARGPAYEAIFLVQPQGVYRLAYGNPEAEQPRYDAAAINALLAADVKPVVATLGPIAPLAEVAEKSESLLLRLLDSGLFLALATGVLVVLLAFGLYRAMQRVDQLPRE
ncbi:MAG: DUF3999 family protein [Pirellulales bacterium]|nr:DUF3999 family protein [Pirellulales bacterium]